MQTWICEIPEDHGYVLPIADLHIGDPQWGKKGKEKLNGYIKWILENQNTRIVLMGDILNTATRLSKTNPIESTPLKYQIQEAIALLTPIKKFIVGAISGNHEQRIYDFCGYDPTMAICDPLDIKYASYSAVCFFKVKKRNNGFENTYSGYFHHTIGGGGMVGSRINRVEKLREIVANADFYVGAHNHTLITAPLEVLEIDKRHHKVIRKRQVIVSCGSFLDWDESYAEAKQMPPSKLGSPRIRLDGKTNDIHVSL